MTKLLVFAIRDRALDAFMRPFYMQTIGQAVRMFQDEVNRNEPNNPLHQHPEDYDLYQLATFTEDNGKFEDNTPIQVAIGKQMIRSVS